MYILQIHEILNFLKPSSLGSKEDLRNPPSHLAETWGRTQTSPFFLVFVVLLLLLLLLLLLFYTARTTRSFEEALFFGC